MIKSGKILNDVSFREEAFTSGFNVLANALLLHPVAFMPFPCENITCILGLYLPAMVVIRLYN